MNVFRGVWVLGLLAAPSVAAQKTILINDTLAANADKLKVNNPAQWAGRIAGWRFGDYAVVTSKQGPVETTTREDFFRLKADSSTSEKFSFVLTNKTMDSAMVSAARNSSAQLLRSVQLGNGWSLGADEVVSESDNFAAFITINRDTSDTWVFFLGVTGSPSYTGFLTNGERRITLAVASSNRNAFDLSGWPALGYEFFEDGGSLGAIQHFGGLSQLAQFVWLDRNLDPRTKLILAAAMTAVLQVTRRT